MIQENINNQEGSISESGSKPFDPKDEMRKAELEAKFGNPEDIVGRALSGPETSSEFEGSKIFIFDKGGVFIRYALRRNGDGRLEGNSFLMQTKEFSGNGTSWKSTMDHMGNLDRSNPNSQDYRIAWTQQMHEPELKAMEKLLGKEI